MTEFLHCVLYFSFILLFFLSFFSTFFVKIKPTKLLQVAGDSIVEHRKFCVKEQIAVSQPKDEVQQFCLRSLENMQNENGADLVA